MDFSLEHTLSRRHHVCTAAYVARENLVLRLISSLPLPSTCALRSGAWHVGIQPTLQPTTYMSARMSMYVEQ